MTTSNHVQAILTFHHAPRLIHLLHSTHFDLPFVLGLSQSLNVQVDDVRLGLEEDGIHTFLLVWLNCCSPAILVNVLKLLTSAWPTLRITAEFLHIPSRYLRVVHMHQQHIQSFEVVYQTKEDLKKFVNMTHIEEVIPDGDVDQWWEEVHETHPISLDEIKELCI